MVRSCTEKDSFQFAIFAAYQQKVRFKQKERDAAIFVNLYHRMTNDQEMKFLVSKFKFESFPNKFRRLEVLYDASEIYNRVKCHFLAICIIRGQL